MIAATDVIARSISTFALILGAIQLGYQIRLMRRDRVCRRAAFSMTPRERAQVNPTQGMVAAARLGFGLLADRPTSDLGDYDWRAIAEGMEQT